MRQSFLLVARPAPPTPGRLQVRQSDSRSFVRSFVRSPARSFIRSVCLVHWYRERWQQCKNPALTQSIFPHYIDACRRVLCLVCALNEAAAAPTTTSTSVGNGSSSECLLQRWRRRRRHERVQCNLGREIQKLTLPGRRRLACSLAFNHSLARTHPPYKKALYTPS